MDFFHEFYRSFGKKIKEKLPVEGSDVCDARLHQMPLMSIVDDGTADGGGVVKNMRPVGPFSVRK